MITTEINVDFYCNLSFSMCCSGDGEVVPASDGADVQPAQEATNPGEGSPGGQNYLKD